MQKSLAVINLKNIRENAIYIRSILKERLFFAVVKADAYGHGAEEVARYIEDIADYFVVAIVDEGVALRIAGISKPVLVLTPPLDYGDVLRAQCYSLTLTVNSLSTAKLIKNVPCHIKVNTGMNRLGCSLSELKDILSVLNKADIMGVYSHLYAPENQAASFKQLSHFKTFESIVKKVNPEAVAHLSASGGLLRGGDYLLDGARCGILLYGYAPNGFSSLKLKPALKVYARKIQTTKFIGGGLGYNFADRKYNELGVYRLGYADGFLRRVPLGEKTLCMDSFISEDGEEYKLVMSDADEYARRTDTISYEVLTSVTKRSERIYER